MSEGPVAFKRPGGGKVRGKVAAGVSSHGDGSSGRLEDDRQFRNRTVTRRDRHPQVAF